MINITINNENSETTDIQAILKSVAKTLMSDPNFQATKKSPEESEMKFLDYDEYEYSNQDVSLYVEVHANDDDDRFHDYRPNAI